MARAVRIAVLLVVLVGLSGWAIWKRHADQESCGSRFSNATLDYGSPPDVGASPPQEALASFRTSDPARASQLTDGPYHEASTAGVVELVSENGRTTVSVTHGPGGWYVTSIKRCFG